MPGHVAHALLISENLIEDVPSAGLAFDRVTHQQPLPIVNGDKYRFVNSLRSPRWWFLQNPAAIGIR
jgi:hypothetical protein